MKRRSFLTSLSVLAAYTIIPDIGDKKIIINSTSNADNAIGIYRTNGVERMRIMSSGNICIGNATDNEYKLNI